MLGFSPNTGKLRMFGVNFDSIAPRHPNEGRLLVGSANNQTVNYYVDCHVGYIMESHDIYPTVWDFTYQNPWCRITEPRISDTSQRAIQICEHCSRELTKER